MVREASLSSCIENVFSSKDDVGKLPQHPLNLEEEPGSKLLQVESLGHLREGKFGKQRAPDPCDKFMTEATSMGTTDKLKSR